MRSILATLILGMWALFAAAGPAGADLANLTAEERAILRNEVRAYLLENPELIVEVINELERRRQAQQEASDKALVTTNLDEIQNDGFSWVGGNPNGNVTLVEFMDYRCGYCRRAFAEVDQLLAEDGNIRFVVKEWPILGEESVKSARMAVATLQVAGDEAYKAVHDRLMTFNGPINPQSVARILDDLGLGAHGHDIIAAMDSDAVTQHIARVHSLAQRLRITGTPAFVMGDQLLRGYLQPDQMRQVLAQVRAAASQD